MIRIGFLVIERKYQAALIAFDRLATPDFVNGKEVDQLGDASLKVRVMWLSILRLADDLDYPLLMEVGEVIRAYAVMTDEFLATIANDGNKAGINAQVLILIQGILSLTGKRTLVGSPLS